MSRKQISDMTGGLHISASAVRQVLECPREFWFAKFLGEKPEHISARMILGSACHRSLARFYEALRDGEGEPISTELVAIAHAALDEAASGSVPILFDEGENLDTLRAESARLLDAFLASPFRPARVLAVEEAFAVPLAHPETGEVPHPELLAGVFDLVVEDAQGNVAVVDHKVGKRRPQQVEGGDLQLGLYSLAAREVFQLSRLANVGHQVVLRTKTAKVEFDVREVGAAEAREAMEAAINAVELIRIAVEHTDPARLLGRRRSWRCTGCGFRTRCAQAT